MLCITTIIKIDTTATIPCFNSSPNKLTIHPNSPSIFNSPDIELLKTSFISKSGNVFETYFFYFFKNVDTPVDWAWELIISLLLAKHEGSNKSKIIIINLISLLKRLKLLKLPELKVI